jgi:hypothetical protein
MAKIKTVGIQSKPEVDLEAIDEAANEEQAEIDEEIENIEQETESKTEKEPEKPKIDYETKFKESQKEAMVLKAQLDKIEAEKDKKVIIDEVFLNQKYPDWEEMTTGEQRAIKKAEELEQEVQEIKNNANKFNNDREWQEKVNNFVTDDLPVLLPDIVGREEDFIKFATRPTRKGTPLEELGKIYLYDNPPPPKKRNLFHSGSSAGDSPTPENGSDADLIKKLRESEPAKFMKLVRAGKIKIKI